MGIFLLKYNDFVRFKDIDEKYYSVVSISKCIETRYNCFFWGLMVQKREENNIVLEIICFFI